MTPCHECGARSHGCFCSQQPEAERRYFEQRRWRERERKRLWGQIGGLHSLVSKLGKDYGLLSGKHQVLKSRHRNVMRLLEREYPEAFAAVQEWLKP